MRILLDHNIPVGLARLLSGHEVAAASAQGWQNLANGMLLTTAEQAGFEVMITADQGIVYQQNLKGRKIVLIVLSTNHWATLRANAKRITAAIGTKNEEGSVFLQLFLGVPGE